MIKKFIRKLIDVEIKLGFLHIPAMDIEMMPDNNDKIAVTIDGIKIWDTLDPKLKINEVHRVFSEKER